MIKPYTDHVIDHIPLVKSNIIPRGLVSVRDATRAGRSPQTVRLLHVAGRTGRSGRLHVGLWIAWSVDRGVSSDRTRVRGGPPVHGRGRPIRRGRPPGRDVLA